VQEDQEGQEGEGQEGQGVDVGDMKLCEVCLCLSASQRISAHLSCDVL
jgi:hypothetical protein